MRHRTGKFTLCFWYRKAGDAKAYYGRETVTAASGNMASIVIQRKYPQVRITFIGRPQGWLTLNG